MSLVAAWRKPTQYRRAVVVGALDEVATTLLVPASEWATFAEAMARGPHPSRLILVTDVPPPPEARYAVDAVVRDDPDAIGSAVRVTDTELSRIASSLPDTVLARIVLAASPEELPSLGDHAIEDIDVPRLARAADVEGRLRTAFDRPIREAQPVSASLTTSEWTTDEAPPPAMLAALLLVAFLRGGMRVAGGPQLRGPATPTNTLPDAADVALLLREEVPLPAVIPGGRLTFSLDREKEAVVIKSSEEVILRATSGPNTILAASGHRVNLPLDLLTAPDLTVSLQATDRGDRG